MRSHLAKLLIACAAVVSFASAARAEYTKTRVELTWRHQPRTTQLALMRAELPNGIGYVLYSREPSTYTYLIAFSSGYVCMTVANLNETLILSCGTPEGVWQLQRNPHRPNCELDWVQLQNGTLPKGEGS